MSTLENSMNFEKVSWTFSCIARSVEVLKLEVWMRHERSAASSVSVVVVVAVVVEPPLWEFLAPSQVGSRPNAVVWGAI